MKNTLFVDINGRLTPSTEARISVFDSALFYGEGLFETLKAEGRRVLFLDRHLDRLWRSCRALGFDLPVSRRELTRRLYRLLKRSRLTDAYLRINVSRHETEVGRRRRACPGRFDCAHRRLSRRAGGGYHVILFVRRFDPYPARCYRKGARLIIVRSVTNDPPPLANIKSTNYLAKIVARHEVARRGADEGILLNAAGRITECSSSNIFIVRRGTIVTPPLSEGVMPGVRRDLVREICRRLKIKYLEACLAPSEVREADEVFITSTLKGVMPVFKIDAHTFRPVPGLLTRRVTGAYADWVIRSCVR